MKTRKGLDDDHLTYLDAGRIAQESGVAAIALHGRTVEQAYSGQADWDAIAELVGHVDIPVLGNGDIWEAADAVRMVEETGVAGVVVGRGCLGRPWLFRDLAAAFAGEQVATLPTLGEVRAMMRRHAELLSEHMGEERGCKEFRKHVTWYLKGFRGRGRPAAPLALVDSLATLDALLADLDPDEAFPVGELGTPRGRQGAPRKRVVLPEGWLDDTDGRGPARPRGRARGHGRITLRLHAAGDREIPRTTPPRIGTGREILCFTRRSVASPPEALTGSRVGQHPPARNSKGSALWLSIATSGTPMPAAPALSHPGGRTRRSPRDPVRRRRGCHDLQPLHPRHRGPARLVEQRRRRHLRLERRPAR